MPTPSRPARKTRASGPRAPVAWTYLGAVGEFIRDWSKRISAPTEIPRPPLVAMERVAEDEERQVVDFLTSRRAAACSHVLIDVGPDATTMLSSVYSAAEVSSMPTTPGIIRFSRPADRRATHSWTLAQALGPAPRCGVCTIMLAAHPILADAGAGSLLRQFTG